MQRNLDPCVKADQCAQNVDDIGIAAKTATDLIGNIGALFQSICIPGLTVKNEMCHFGVRQVDFLGKTFSSQRVSTQTHKVQNILKKVRFPKTKKAFAVLPGARELLQILHSQEG